ncbi:hypothetical protein D3C76_1186350 [compost metagenome]
MRLEQVTPGAEFVAYTGQNIDGIDHSIGQRFLCRHPGKFCRVQGQTICVDFLAVRIGSQVSAGDLLDHPAPDRFQLLLGGQLILVKPTDPRRGRAAAVQRHLNADASNIAVSSRRQGVVVALVGFLCTQVQAHGRIVPTLATAQRCTRCFDPTLAGLEGRV